MHTHISSFQLQKDGNTQSQCEDAWTRFPSKESFPRPYCRVAVADGATESAYSGLWAQKLVKAYSLFERLQPPSMGDIAQLVSDSAQSWRQEVWSKQQSWFAIEKAQKGSFSTLLGLQLIDSDDPTGGRWSAFIVGDTCLFQIRDNQLLTKFPIEHSSGFDNHPLLLSTDPARNSDALTQTLLAGIFQGHWQTGDRFLLMTDAAAQWLLAAYERGETPWNDLLCSQLISSTEHLKNWVTQARTNKSMRNDDVTLVEVIVSKELS